ncbi:MAG: iron-sulfur binding hydrogenase [Spirochaetales bacterium]|nr:iron-sulfur binding hydrogenase [Spirochaetales bacterium]
MKAGEIGKLEGYKLVVAGDPDAEITNAYTGDLLSDVMGHAPDQSVLITIQAHKNTIAVCSLAGAVAVVICNDREVPEDMRQSAASEGVSIFATKDDQFTASVKVASLMGKVTLN